MQSGFWDIFLLNGNLQLCKDIVHLPLLLKDHRGRLLGGCITQSYTWTGKRTHTHTHTCTFCQVTVWHFLGTYGLVSVISKGHINTDAVGLFVPHGKQRVCHLLCNLLWHFVLWCPPANIILVTPPPARAAQTACYRLSHCYCHYDSNTSDCIDKKCGDFTAYCW